VKGIKDIKVLNKMYREQFGDVLSESLINELKKRIKKLK